MNSNNGFQTNVWGPMAWIFFHMVTLSYKPDRKQDTFSFFKSLKGVLPCAACRSNFHTIINGKNPKYRLTLDKLKSRQTLCWWLFTVHNEVQRGIFARSNSPADKPLYSDTKSDFKKSMLSLESMRAKCYKNSHGCTIPVKGARKRAEIHVLPRLKCPKLKKDPLVIHKRCI